MHTVEVRYRIGSDIEAVELDVTRYGYEDNGPNIPASVEFYDNDTNIFSIPFSAFISIEIKGRVRPIRSAHA